MRRTGLFDIYNRFERRCRRLEQWVNVWPSNRNHPSVIQELVCPTVVVNRLQYLFGQFCCELVVRSAMGGCVTRTGSTLSRVSGVKKVSDISRAAGKPLTGPQAKWDIPAFGIGFSTALGVTNQLEISRGLQSADLGDLKILRNYVVHPNRHTGLIYISMVRQHGLREIEPDRFIRHQTTGGPAILEAWVQNLLDSAWNAIE